MFWAHVREFVAEALEIEARDGPGSALAYFDAQTAIILASVRARESTKGQP
jgi:hypothetical protein